jgi:hypothetical protein
MNTTRYIETLRTANGYNGGTIVLSIVWCRAQKQLLCVHEHGWHPIPQDQLDWYRAHPQFTAQDCADHESSRPRW